MGTSQQHKAASRAAIVNAAAELFRERGLEGVSVAEVMDAAGLTHGGFQRHFANKQALVAEALASALYGAGKSGVIEAGGVEAFAGGYLTKLHRDNPGKGCAYAALGAEVARADPQARGVMSDAIRRQIEEFTPPGADGDKAPDAEAVGKWAAMIGALVLARISESETVSEQILTATKTFIGAPK